ncbi:MAG: histidine triad family protein [Hyphomicrobiales bacterium]|jgi:histidine triad (HIT) family protein|nr:histidine triad family protein [Hyphomicrobiales bacterium]
MATECLFCRIATRAVVADVVHEEEHLLAFLDIHPIRPGHVLIVPKRHFDYFEDAPAGIAASIVALGQRLARVMKQIYRVPQVGFLFAGSDIPHVHAHLVPMHEKTDLTSRHYIVERTLTFVETPRAPGRELAETAALLAGALRAAG